MRPLMLSLPLTMLVLACSAASPAGGDGSTVQSCAPPSTPSKQSVTLRVRNTSATPRYIATSGDGCSSTLLLSNGKAIPQELPRQCPCECANLGQSSTYRRLDPGATYDFVWDARRLETCTATVDCSAYTGPPRTGQQQEGWRVPVPAGTYDFRVGALAAPPADCLGSAPPVQQPPPVDDAGTDDAGADASSDGGPPALPPEVTCIKSAWSAPREPSGLCPSTWTVSARFELPASGDLVVEVPVQ